MASYTEIDDPSLHFQIMTYVGTAGIFDPADGSTAARAARSAVEIILLLITVMV